MQLVLRAAGLIGIIVSVIWWIIEPSFDPLYAFITGLVAFLSSFVIPQQETQAETLDQRNRRVMLNHMANFWVKGILEKSLHGAALLELGIKEDPTAVSYPWTIKKGATNETLPAGKSMLEIFEEIGMGRSLLILGAPGSGKTTMLLELARQLIERARQEETEPIPVVFNLSSWKDKQTFADWLAEQLNSVYYVPKKTTPTWVNDNRMLLLLDGLDEVKADSRVKCVEAINQFRKEHGFTSVVVCSRIEEYSAINTKLLLEGAITLQPLTPKQINAYFERFGESLAVVKKLLKKDKALQELAETPLMLSIMALAYKDGKAGELVASGNFEQQRKHLFDTYITRMFERSNRTKNAPFSKEQALHYLHWLARMMIKHNIVTYQIETMQTEWLEARSQSPLYRSFFGLSVGLIVGPGVGLIFGLMAGLMYGMIFGRMYGLSVGLIAALIAALIAGLGGREKIVMVDKLKWSWKEVRNGLIRGLIMALIMALFFGLIVGLSVGLIVGPTYGLSVGLMYGRMYGLIAALITALIMALLFVLMTGLMSEQIEETTYPGQRLKQTLFNVIFVIVLVMLIGGLIFVLSVALIFVLIGRLSVVPILLMIGGPIGGLSLALIMMLIYAGRAFLQHFVLRFVLVLYQLLPRRLVPFLEYAVDLIFLRRVGGSYIFVHRTLMEHFAEMEV